MDVRWVFMDNWREARSPLLDRSQPECGPHPDKVSTKVFGGGYPPQIRVLRRGDYIFLGVSQWNALKLTGSLLITEDMVPTCIKARTKSLTDWFGEGIGGLYGTVPAGRTTPPCPAHPKSRHPIWNWWRDTNRGRNRGGDQMAEEEQGSQS